MKDFLGFVKEIALPLFGTVLAIAAFSYGVTFAMLLCAAGAYEALGTETGRQVAALLAGLVGAAGFAFGASALLERARFGRKPAGKGGADGEA